MYRNVFTLLMQSTVSFLFGFCEMSAYHIEVLQSCSIAYRVLLSLCKEHNITEQQSRLSLLIFIFNKLHKKEASAGFEISLHYPFFLIQDH